MSAVDDITDFVQSAVRGLCKKPSLVSVQPIESGGKTVLIIVKCDDSDVSLVIGRQGRNIKALRDLAWAISAKHDLKLTLIVNE